MSETMHEPSRGKDKATELRQRSEGRKGRGKFRRQLLTPGIHWYWGSPENMDLLPKGSEMELLGTWIRIEIQKPNDKSLLPPGKGRELLVLAVALVASFKYHLTNITTSKMPASPPHVSYAPSN